MLLDLPGIPELDRSLRCGQRGTIAAMTSSPNMKTKVEQRRVSIDKLLNAALHLFVSMGYSSTNLDKIAGAAGLSKGAVYFYFGSKESVLIEVLKRVQVVVLDKAIEVVDLAGPSYTEKVVAFLHNAANLGITHRDEVLLLIIMSLEFKEREGEVRDCIGRIYQQLHTMIEGLILAGQKAGEFRNDVPAHELAAIVMANHDGTFLEWYRRSGSLKGTDLVRALRSVVVGGLHHSATKLRPARQPARTAGKR